MDRVVLDTSSHVRAILRPSGASGGLVDLWTAGAFDLVCSESILAELDGVLRRPHIQRRYGPTTAAIEYYLAAVRRNSIMTPGELVVEGVADDPDDDHVLTCAL